MFWRESLPDVEGVGYADGNNWVGFQGRQVAFPLGDLGLQIALDGDGDGVGGAGDVGALGLRLVIASPSGEVRVERGLPGDGDAELKREGEVSAFARDHVAPAGGDGEGRLGGVEAERRIAVDGSGAGGGIGVGGVEGLVVEGEAGSTGHGIGSRELVAVVEQQAGTDAPSEPGGVIVQRHAGGSEVEAGIGGEAVGGEVGGVFEDVAGSPEIEVLVDVGGHLKVDAQRRNAGAEGKS